MTQSKRVVEFFFEPDSSAAIKSRWLSGLHRTLVRQQFYLANKSQSV